MKSRSPQQQVIFIAGLFDNFNGSALNSARND